LEVFGVLTRVRVDV